MDVYWSLFVPAAIGALWLEYVNRYGAAANAAERKNSPAGNRDFTKFRVGASGADACRLMGCLAAGGCGTVAVLQRGSGTAAAVGRLRPPGC